MKSRIFILAIALTFLFHPAGGSALAPQARVVEPETGIAFPAEVRFSQDSEDYELRLTGVTARKKWFFNVYAIANYLQVQKGAGAPDRETILTDGPAKQMTIQYARTVSAEKVTTVLREDFEENTTASEYRQIEASVKQMMAYFVRPVKKGDVFVMRWLPGGHVYLELNEKKLGDVKSVLFARTLWSIWFGEHSVVDTEALMTKNSMEEA